MQALRIVSSMPIPNETRLADASHPEDVSLKLFISTSSSVILKDYSILAHLTTRSDS